MNAKKLFVSILCSPWTWLKWAGRTFKNVALGLIEGKISDTLPPQPFVRGPKINNAFEYQIYQDTRARLAEEMKFRRDRQWTLATWVAGLFTALIGGVIALMAQGKELTIGIQLGLTLWVALVAICASIRILHDSVIGDYHAKACFQMDKHFGLEFDDSKHKIDMKQHHLLMTFIVILAIGTSLLLWQKGLIKSAPEIAKECPGCSQVKMTNTIPVLKNP
jgi:hypothetical protein